MLAPAEHHDDRPIAHSPSVAVQAVALPPRHQGCRRKKHVLNAQTALAQMMVEPFLIGLVTQVQNELHANGLRITGAIVNA